MVSSVSTCFASVSGSTLAKKPKLNRLLSGADDAFAAESALASAFAALEVPKNSRNPAWVALLPDKGFISGINRPKLKIFGASCAVSEGAAGVSVPRLAPEEVNGDKKPVNRLVSTIPNVLS